VDKSFHKADFIDFTNAFVVFIGPNEGLIRPINQFVGFGFVEERLAGCVGEFGEIRFIEIRGIAAVVD
jgi:hypothetical protein